MADGDPRPENLLGPYYPSEVPRIPGNGRRWVALLVAALHLAWLIGNLLQLLTA